MAFLTAADGTALFYYDWGTGDPVILLHGWPLHSASWESQAQFLVENGHRVIAYDKRGFGRSDWAYKGYDYDTLADDLHSFITNLDLKNITLVGFSMGGGEVVRYLAKYGEQRIKKAVLIASVTPFLLKTANNPQGIDGENFLELKTAVRNDRPDFLKNFAEKFYNYSLLNRSVSQSHLNFFQLMALAASPQATLELMNAWSSTDFRDDLASITIPTLIIHGTKDQAVPIEISAYLSVKLMQNALLIEYADECHGLITTASKRLNNDLLNFIRCDPIALSRLKS